MSSDMMTMTFGLAGASAADAHAAKPMANARERRQRIERVPWRLLDVRGGISVFFHSILLAPDLRRNEVRGLRLGLGCDGLLCVPREYVLQFLQLLGVLLREVGLLVWVIFQVEEFN